MGYEEVAESQHVSVRDFFGGWFPGRNHNDIPGELAKKGLIGSPDCNNVAWYEGALRKLYGYSALTTSALNSGASVNSIFYSQILDDVVGNAGDKLFSGMDEVAPSDITDSVVISSTALIDWTEFQFDSVKIVIGVDGVNPPWKWTGSGNAALLGGSPPTGEYVTTWQNVIWMAVAEKLEFSNLVDPETWSANDNYVFDAPITGIGRLNRQLVVFMEDHIGILSGDNNRQLIKHDRFIDGIGCSGHHTISNAKVNNQDVLVFHANDGVYAFNGSQNVFKLSDQIEQKYVSATSNLKWNSSRYDKFTGVYDPRFNWYYMGVTDGSDTENDFMLLADLARPYNTTEGIAVPFWPNDSLNKPIVSIEFTRTLDKNGDIIFGSDDGKVYKMDQSVYTRDGATYTADYKTKVFDIVNTSIVQEFNVLSEEGGDRDLTVYINSSLEEGDGNQGSTDFSGGNDVLDTTFIMDSSTLGGADFLLRNVGVGNFGRFLQFKFENAEAGQEMIVIGLDLILKNIGTEPNAGN
jgi:hypothetical protein